MEPAGLARPVPTTAVNTDVLLLHILLLFKKQRGQASRSLE
jgi:hypothetical protein